MTLDFLRPVLPYCASLIRIVAMLLSTAVAKAGTVTLITHGYGSDARTWVASLADAINAYPRKSSQFGTTDSIYFLSYDASGFLHAKRLSTSTPSTSASGDIILLLDWNPYSGSLSIAANTSTVDVAPSVATALLSKSFLPELNGTALASFPIHLIGHSRGGSLVCEIGKYLGEQGIAVDHLTLLDPHPLNADVFAGAFLDIVAGSAIDGSVNGGVYENATFAESIYETVDTPSGTYSLGSYIRNAEPLQQFPLTTFFGYGSDHSNIHLWYHATLTNDTTAANDGSAKLSPEGRGLWFKDFEARGLHAGYYYSLAGGGSREEQVGPANANSGRPIDGLNHGWTNIYPTVPSIPNRRSLAIKSSRANLISTKLLGTGGRSSSLALTNFYQGAPLYYFAVTPQFNTLSALVGYWVPSGFAGVKVFVDDDQNPLNGYSDGVPLSASIPASGSRSGTISVDLSALAKLPAGRYYVGFTISDPSGQRYMYAPEFLVVLPDLTLAWKLEGSKDSPQFDFSIRGVANAGYLLQNSADLSAWDTIVTGNLSPGPDAFVGGAQWNGVRGNFNTASFFRVVYK